MSLGYTIEEHQHRFAAWAAATAAARSPKCRFKVEQGVKILKAAGFDKKFSFPAQLSTQDQIDCKHRVWRELVIKKAKLEKLNFTHGIAAKLINCYLKARFVCVGQYERFKWLHPPIDALLLKGLAERNVGGRGEAWRDFSRKRWSKFDSDTYESLIKLMREVWKKEHPGQPFWKIEQYWPGYQ